MGQTLDNSFFLCYVLSKELRARLYYTPQNVKIMSRAITLIYRESQKTGRWYLSLSVDLGYRLYTLTVDRSQIAEILDLRPSELDRLIDLVCEHKPVVPGKIYRFDVGSVEPCEDL